MTAIPVGVPFLPNLLNSHLSALITLEFDDAYVVGKDDRNREIPVNRTNLRIGTNSPLFKTLKKRFNASRLAFVMSKFFPRLSKIGLSYSSINTTTD